MENQHLHIVSLNVPYPANYGGVIDIFYKIRALAEIGVRIHLHCFEYGREHSSELAKYCESITYYQRKTGFWSWLSAKPYIVQSRKSKLLLQNLIALPYPILFEGLHTTYYLNHRNLKERFKIVRTHNVEHDYYQGLRQQEKNWLKRHFFLSEEKKLKHYEKVLRQAQLIAAISPEDTRYFSNLFTKIFWLPPFHPCQKISGKEGMGSFVLYHADLSVSENIEAVKFLIKSFKDVELPLVIAGRNPSMELQNKLTGFPHIILVANPSQTEMDRLISDAHILALPTFQSTGIKLKLIASLFQGRHCVVNTTMVQHTGLEIFCHIADTPETFGSSCLRLMEQPFTQRDIEQRQNLLEEPFNNLENARKLMDQIQFED